MDRGTAERVRREGSGAMRGWGRLGFLLVVGITGVIASEAGAQPRLPRARSTAATQPAATQAATQAATAPSKGKADVAAPVVTRAAEPESPVVEVEEYEPFGFAGGGRRRRGEVPGAVGSDFIPIADRWRIGIPGDYVQNVRGAWYDPYNQNVLKGDYPIVGDDKFLIVTVTSDTLFEARRLPVPSGVSTIDPGSLAFFGVGEQQLINQNVILSIEFFKGDAAYRPRDWELRITPVFNMNFVRAEEFTTVFPDPARGRYRDDYWIGLQEAFVEKHLGDLSESYDFWAVRAGIQGFTSDFRGFLFSDNEPGVRLFGSYDNNKLQWNLAWFHMLEKDTNSGLNSYDERDQDVFIANLYRQDFLWLGYTAQLSLHANIDESDFELDENGFLVRPQPIGTIREKEVRAYYVGWAGDGHIGRVNVSHQFYQVFGEETFNPIADQQVDINAQFFAAEVSYDQDWIRYRGSFAWASGDDDPLDGSGEGFDGIFDNPNVAGGGFSFLTRQALRLTGSGVNLVNRNSFYPDLRTSKEQGQANFVNPGLFLYNVGMDIELTPRWKAILNATYLQFADTEVIQRVLFDDRIDREIGMDYSIGIQYRPFLNNNFIVTVGGAALVPGKGFADIYSGEVFYSGFVGLTLTY